MKKILPIVLIACSIIIGSVVVGGFLQKQNAEKSNSTTPAPQAGGGSTRTQTTDSTKTFTTDEVTKHATSSDCWLIIEDKVYDVTDFLGSHPGGAQQITPYCGKEASDAFASRGGEGSHSSSAQSMLKEYFIGSLQ